MTGEGILAVHDHRQGLTVVGFLEGGRATHQHIEDNTEGPDI
jgi:hypothetical protein